MVGCLDLVRFTADGIRNTAMASNDRRKRLPRMLYGAERVMRQYSQVDAEIKALLVSHDPRLHSLALVDCVRDSNGVFVAAVSDGMFLYLHRGQLLQVPMRDIASVNPRDQVVSLNMHHASGTRRAPIWLRGPDACTLHSVARMLRTALGAL